MKAITTLKVKKRNPSGFDAKKFEEEFKDTYESKAGFTTKKTFAPSTMGYGHGNCARYWFLAFSGSDFIDTANVQAKAAMENGNFVHNRLQSRFSKMDKSYRVIDHEIDTWHDDPPIHGYLDTLIEDLDNSQLVPLELKSAKDEQFSMKKHTLEASSNQMIQLLTYMKIHGYPQGCFVYENKNDQTLLFIVINMDEENEKLIDYVFNWLRGVYDLYENKTLPTRAFERASYTCKGCPVKPTCWKDMKDSPGDVDYPAMKPGGME